MSTLHFPSRTSYKPSVVELYSQDAAMTNLNPASKYDNRDVIRRILELRPYVSAELHDWMVDPYDSGFYRHPLCNGISALLPWWRKLGAKQWGLDNHPGGSAHDCGYYRGLLSKKENDRLFLLAMETLFQVDPHIRFAFKIGLNIRVPFIPDSFDAWEKHAKKRASIPLYGTDAYLLTKTT